MLLNVDLQLPRYYACRLCTESARGPPGRDFLTPSIPDVPCCTRCNKMSDTNTYAMTYAVPIIYVIGTPMSGMHSMPYLSISNGPDKIIRHPYDDLASGKSPI